jgi:phosphoribosylaminoimidazole-succinocarboxamide synthase
MASALLTSSLPDLTLVSRGKVRDIYATSSKDHLLFVATDRISVFDVILKNVRDHLRYIVTRSPQKPV